MSMNVLVMGATGYVGARLVPRLLERGYRVRCLVRNPQKLQGKHWAGDVEICQGDVFDYRSLLSACDGVDMIFYLVHLMGQGEKRFESLDRQAAKNTSQAAGEKAVKRIVYLGGLGRRDIRQSPHLRSRHEVGDILRQGIPSVTEFRAAVIVGSGSLSFEMIHHLVNRLPAMICPRWVFTRTQPIAIRDVLSYLTDSVENARSIGKLIDIGGPEVLSYKDMMITVARVLNLRRYILEVPVLTPRLSSYWVNLMTPMPAQVARALIEGLRYETVCENDDALKLFDIKPLSFEDAVRRALTRVFSDDVESSWTDASSSDINGRIDPSHLKIDKREIEVDASGEKVFEVISSIGGNNGWYYANWLWQLRGFIDKQLGGAGLRRGRRHPRNIAAGDALDFWRVEQYEQKKKLRLHAEMKVWGQAWLEFEVNEIGNGKTRLVQTAEYYPRGLGGHIYWYGVFPLHALVFKGLIRKIAMRAEHSASDGVKIQ